MAEHYIMIADITFDVWDFFKSFASYSVSQSTYVLGAFSEKEEAFKAMDALRNDPDFEYIFEYISLPYEDLSIERDRLVLRNKNYIKGFILKYIDSEFDFDDSYNNDPYRIEIRLRKLEDGMRKPAKFISSI